MPQEKQDLTDAGEELPPLGEAGAAPSGATLRARGSTYALEEDYSFRAQEAFEACRGHLKTGIFDWVVTDGDTANVIAALEPLTFAELIAVMHKMGETRDGGSNLLEKLYERGLESREQVARWRKLFHDKLLLAVRKDGAFPDLNARVAEYQTRYVKKETLGRGF